MKPSVILLRRSLLMFVQSSRHALKRLQGAKARIPRQEHQGELNTDRGLPMSCNGCWALGSRGQGSLLRGRNSGG